LAWIFAAFLLVITFSSAAGSSTSTSAVSSSSFEISSPSVKPSSVRFCFTYSTAASTSMPFLLKYAPVRSLIAQILHPSRASSCAATLPTLPKPCTASVVPATFMPRCRSASFVTIMQPRPVASRRPSEPPISTGLPVTTAVTVCRWCMEYVSITHAITRSFVLTSGAGTSESGPSVWMIPAV
jgi:hypothetical protein